jgi:hypothetical protein
VRGTVMAMSDVDAHISIAEYKHDERFCIQQLLQVHIQGNCEGWARTCVAICCYHAAPRCRVHNPSTSNLKQTVCTEIAHASYLV